MKIPKTVKIGGLVYGVIITDNLRGGADNFSGEIDYLKQTIKLVEGMSSDRTERDFLHEVVHGIYDNLGHTNHDEKQIDELAGALYALIVDNPEIFRCVERDRETTAAVKTLQHLGYSYCGGELWKPPLGGKPTRFKSKR